jgi:flagellar biosynthesis GTPase FlhF
MAKTRKHHLRKRGTRRLRKGRISRGGGGGASKPANAVPATATRKTNAERAAARAEREAARQERREAAAEMRAARQADAADARAAREAAAALAREERAAAAAARAAAQANAREQRAQERIAYQAEVKAEAENMKQIKIKEYKDSQKDLVDTGILTQSEVDAAAETVGQALYDAHVTQKMIEFQLAQVSNIVRR